MTAKPTDSEIAVTSQMVSALSGAAEQPAQRYARPEERKRVGLRINPTTATVFFDYAQIIDPYGDDPELPEECQCVGRVFFAVDPDDRIAVCFYDLPETTRAALDEKRAAADRDGWRLILGALTLAGERPPAEPA
jgi:hypothetical protein